MSSEGGFLGQPKLTTPQTCSGRPRNTASSSSAVGIQSRKPSSSQQAAGCVLNENTNGTPRQSSPPNSCVTGLESNHTGYHKKRLAVFIVTLTLFLDLCLMTVLVPIAPAYLNLSAEADGAYTKLGVLFASNAGVQLIANIFLGRIIDRFGSSQPLFGGVLAMTISTIGFAFAGDLSWTHRYKILLAARMLQGISSACAATGGMAWLATLYETDEERGEAIGTAMTGLGLGVLVGPPLGAGFTKFGVDTGWKMPFLILAGLGVINATLQTVLAWSPLRTYTPSADEPQVGHCHAVIRLISDPYVVLTFTLSFFANAVMAVLESSFPHLLTVTFDSKGWILGAIFIPCMLPYILAAPVSGKYLARVGRHWGVLCGTLCLAAGILAMPFVIKALISHNQSVWFTSLPLAFCGVGMGIVDSSVMLFMADVVQKRHASLFGSSCAIVDASVSMAFFVGPLVSNVLIDKFTYRWVYIGLGGLVLLWSPCIYLLHNVTRKSTERGTDEERQPILGARTIEDSQGIVQGPSIS